MNERKKAMKEFNKKIPIIEQLAKKEVFNNLIGLWMELNKKHRDGNKAFAELGKYIRRRCTNSLTTEKMIKKFADAWKVYGIKHDWIRCRKKPVIIKAIEMDCDFKVATKEGVSLAGKKGDYLLEGIEGEVYPCNKQIFEKSYNKVR